MRRQNREDFLRMFFFWTDKGNEIESYVGVTLLESELHFGEDDEWIIDLLHESVVLLLAKYPCFLA